MILIEKWIIYRPQQLNISGEFNLGSDGVQIVLKNH
jgi:hypothetical protein